MKKFILLLLILIVLLSAGCTKKPTAPSTQGMQSGYIHKLEVGKNILSVEVAGTNETRRQGLSDRTSMAENQGMLFDFSNTQVSTPTFWMKDMRFDLDFIWIQNSKVVDVTKNAPSQQKLNLPDYQLPTYSPSKPIDHVLEVNAGWADRHNIKIGDTVVLQN